MTKTELSTLLAEQTGLTKSKAAECLNVLGDLLTEGLKTEGKVAWSGFGSFQRIERAERKGRNPKTGEPINIPASKSVKFKPSRGLKDAL